MSAINGTKILPPDEWGPVTLSSYPAFKKIPRLEREVILTEKIDGTNGLIFIPEDGDHVEAVEAMNKGAESLLESRDRYVFAGSRNRWLSRGSDNFGFASFVADRAEALIKTLGPGLHYGEFWGQGIQRGYGLDHKRFSLFNVSRWGWMANPGAPTIDGVTVVPTLATFGHMTEAMGRIEGVVSDLLVAGSVAAPGFLHPEGVVLFHVASRASFKFTLDGDGRDTKVRHQKRAAKTPYDYPPILFSAPDATGHP